MATDVVKKKKDGHTLLGKYPPWWTVVVKILFSNKDIINYFKMNWVNIEWPLSKVLEVLLGNLQSKIVADPKQDG